MNQCSKRKPTVLVVADCSELLANDLRVTFADVFVLDVEVKGIERKAMQRLARLARR
jgi:hypothetical protein